MGDVLTIIFIISVCTFPSAVAASVNSEVEVFAAVLKDSVRGSATSKANTAAAEIARLI
jgi:hypothetical protein